MANHVSALKRVRQTERRAEMNRANKSRMRTSLRRLRSALNSGNQQEAQTLYRATVSALDKSVQKGVLHKNTASRYKSRLAARVAAMGAK
jgi:small subunit ribosomal protein S20